MALILSIETATTVCSVALAKDGKLLSLREVNAGYSHSENLTVFIEEACKEANISLKQLDAVAVSKGPGSYTGLRIGVSAAKGLCYALEKPLIAISTLKSIANLGLQFSTTNVLLCPMIDARRMEVYCALYDAELNEILPPSALIIDNDSFSDKFISNKISFFGDGASKLKNIFSDQPHAIFPENILASAKGMITLAEEKFSKKEFEDVSLFEPFYLKEAAIGKLK